MSNTAVSPFHARLPVLDLQTVTPVSYPGEDKMRAALNEIRSILGQRQDRPWTTLSQIDQIARKALA